MIKGEITIAVNPEAGGRLPAAKVVYHTSHNKYSPELPVVWICHALTANSDPEDWWPEVVGEGKVLDTRKNFVVCVNMLGSPYGSESPASINPDTGKPWLLDFPKLTLRDMIPAFEAVRKHLGIKKINKLIGSSSGGFQAIEWAVAKPEIFEHCYFMATAPRESPYLGATLENQRMALEADPSFREAKGLEGGAAGLKCARAQAVLSYRSFRCYGLTQGESDEDTLFAGRVASYERHQGDKLVKRGFDAYSYYNLCNQIDSNNVGRGRGGVQAALGRINSDVTVVAIDTDQIFPPEEGKVWAGWIPRARFIVISSDYGHDGFLLETAKLNAILL